MEDIELPSYINYVHPDVLQGMEEGGIIDPSYSTDTYNNRGGGPLLHGGASASSGGMNPGQDGIMFSVGPSGEMSSLGSTDLDQQSFMQFLHDNPNALTSIDSLTLPSLSELTVSGGGAMEPGGVASEHQVSNDMNVGAQESVLDGGVVGGRVSREGSAEKKPHPLHIQ